jgi:hypothetical protein
MAEYKLSLYMTGEFQRAQVERCFAETPSLYLEKGDKNAGGKVVKTSISNFVIAEGESDYLTPVFDEYLEKIRALVFSVMKLRGLAIFESTLSFVVRTDNSNPMPSFYLNPDIMDILSKSKTGFDLDTYHYESLKDR